LRPITVFFSTPGDVLPERARLLAVVDELRPAFTTHGISLETWTFHSNSSPSVRSLGGSVQTVIDLQLPRHSDGSLAYDFYVGLMSRRIGTPLPDAESGTVHEFIEAKEAFEKTGTPRILFYFRQHDSAEPVTDPQVEAVEKFRAQYPGLFATFDSADDLEKQFRRHLLSELLNTVDPNSRFGSTLEDITWWTRLAERYNDLRDKLSKSFLDTSAEKPRRIFRQLHLLFGIEHRLADRERRILIAALYLSLLDPAGNEHVAEQFLPAASELVQEVCDVVQRSRDESKLLIPASGQIRLDLLGALAKLAPMLDLNRGGISPHTAAQPNASSAINDWLAYLTAQALCEHGLIRFCLLVPCADLIQPLTDATALAMEALWQQLRGVLTRHGFAFAVARCRIQIDPDLSFIPPAAIDKIYTAAKQASDALPKQPHFGATELPDLEQLLPLPYSKVHSAVRFVGQDGTPLRLKVNGMVVADRDESDARVIEHLPSSSQIDECVFESDNSGEFLPIIYARLQFLSPIEAAALQQAPSDPDTLAGLALWNDLLAYLWPHVQALEPSREDLAQAFHILRDAFNGYPVHISSSLMARRDLYWDAMESIRKQLVAQEN
jgi:hypothetical protein